MESDVVNSAQSPRPAAVALLPTFEVDRLVREVKAVRRQPWEKPRRWSVSGAPGAAEQEWRVLPLRTPGGDPERTDPGGPGPLDFAATPWFDRLPYLRAIAEGLPAPLAAVRLMSLDPGARVARHRDPKYHPARGFVRLHLPILTDSAAVLDLDGVEYRWQPGELWYADFSLPHEVRNDGDTDRLHAVLDLLMTEQLADLFPARERAALRAGGALFNRMPEPLPPDREAMICSTELPASFLDFGNEQPFHRMLPTVEVVVAAEKGKAVVEAADGSRWALAHLGGGEFRFAGWSDQRTLEIAEDVVILRCRDGRTTRTAVVSARLVQNS